MKLWMTVSGSDRIQNSMLKDLLLQKGKLTGLGTSVHRNQLLL